jgi:predicted transcriptional regulator
MRTIIDITDEQVKALDEISQLEGTSRAALIRQAIDRMLAEDSKREQAALSAFGLWSHTKKDGLEIEALLRRGKVEAPTPKVDVKKQPATQPTVAPPPPPIIEDNFVTTPPPEQPVEAPKVATPPTPPPPPPATPQSVADPLAAFFAGVKP